MVKTELNDNITGHLDTIASDGLTLFLLQEGRFRGALLHGTRLLNEMQANHGTGPLESLVLGHAYLGVGLLVNNLKGDDRIAFSIECGGPIRGLHVEADHLGHVRGSLSENPIPLTAPLESLDLSLLFGPGFLKMKKWVSGASHPFTGQVMLEYGSIGQDLAHYFLTSEQIPTSFSLSIDFGKGGEISGAAGLLIQALPGTTTDEAGVLEDRVLSLPSLGRFFSSGGTADSFMSEHLGDFTPRILGTRPVEFFCPCSRERFQSFLRSMKPEDQEDILKEGPFPLETRCHNCNSVYSFTRPELAALFHRT